MALLRVTRLAESGLLATCPLHSATGLLCPGCGSVRALTALSEGRLLAAWRYNSLAVLLMPVIVLLMACPRETGPVTVRPVMTAALLGTIILYGVLRNVGGFEYLRPHTECGLRVKGEHETSEYSHSRDNGCTGLCLAGA